MLSVKVVGPSYRHASNDSGIVVNTTSKAGWSSELSPFKLGPVYMYGGFRSLTMENAWQYSKVYPGYTKPNGYPNDEWWNWAKQGWNNPNAVRYPMGKGRKPLYAYYNGQLLKYIEARKVIYIPLYAAAVVKTNAFKRLQDLYSRNYQLVLWDYDGYDHVGKGMMFEQVIENTSRSMGHAFVLAMLLERHPLVIRYL